MADQATQQQGTPDPDTDNQAQTPRKSKKPTPYNREPTDALCTLADKPRVEKWLQDQTKKWAAKTTGQRNDPARHGELPKYTTITFDKDGNYQLPPSSVKLSDEHVYLVTKTLSVKARITRKWTEDFNAAGEIRAERIPLDPSPLFYIFGVPCIALFRGYHILVGFSNAKNYGPLANVKNNATVKAAEKDWLIGPILASNEFVNTPRTLTRHYHDETGQNVTTKLHTGGEVHETDALFPSEKGTQATPARFDRITTKLFDLSLWCTNDGQATLTRIVDHPAYMKPTQQADTNMLDEILLELNPDLKALLENISTACDAIPKRNHFAGIIRNIDLVQTLQYEYAAVDGEYQAALQAWTEVQAKTAQFGPAVNRMVETRARPLHDNLRLLANIKGACFGPSGIPSDLYDINFFHPDRDDDSSDDEAKPKKITLGFTGYPDEPEPKPVKPRPSKVTKRRDKAPKAARNKAPRATKGDQDHHENESDDDE
ncbi:hypothetical protein PEBR_20884 [Penicillium brasilianum]|uniref:Uncharacterized protein n=1 Tax=Penicillium brasilianum TaxID=104259 RepID=A0A1S9RNG6_PENBI|nr:hypothetical protein PEBR_20884 [Penicillium brasilianum]